MAEELSADKEILKNFWWVNRRWRSSGRRKRTEEAKLLLRKLEKDKNEKEILSKAELGTVGSSLTSNE